jgi:predicted Rossmann fold nucleotide-binding protein DprA/Smf involved in DNA uptake
MANRIIGLLSEEERLDAYLKKGERADCYPITRIGVDYPAVLRSRLGDETPAVLWARGSLQLLAEPTVALVGSRDLAPENRRFAEELGRQAALQGYTLVSGNARGADRAAQDACLQAGGSVISVMADELWKHPLRERVLYLSEDGFAEGFSAQRALSRNRIIHALGLKTFVAQASLHMGGTWDGTVKNLRSGWSPVFLFRDGSEAMETLLHMGANPVDPEELSDIYDLQNAQKNMFDR